MKPTHAQRRVLLAVAACSSSEFPADGWGEVYTHYDRANGTPSSLEMRNFDRSGDACVRSGWLRLDGGTISLSDAGRTALGKAAKS